jgi:hypothetical protein
MVDVVATADGFVAVGAEVEARRKKRSTSFVYFPMAWSSADGLTWTATRLSDGSSFARQVAVSPDGLVLAAGGDIDSGPRIWRRQTDGTWTELDAPPADVIESSPSILVQAAGRFVLGDFSIRQDEPWLMSMDGGAWMPGPGRLSLPGLPVAAAGGVLFLAAPEDGSGVDLHWSPDWESWTESSVPQLGPATRAWSAGETGAGGVIVATLEPAGESEQPTQHTWLGSPTG